MSFGRNAKLAVGDVETIDFIVESGSECDITERLSASVMYAGMPSRDSFSLIIRKYNPLSNVFILPHQFFYEAKPGAIMLNKGVKLVIEEVTPEFIRYFVEVELRKEPVLVDKN